MVPSNKIIYCTLAETVMRTKKTNTNKVWALLINPFDGVLEVAGNVEGSAAGKWSGNGALSVGALLLFGE